MSKAALVLTMALSLAACSSGMFAPVTVNKTAEEVVDSRTPTAPRDARTRAKLHTELRALYLQNGNMSVALEELTYAITLDGSYAKAYGARGLTLYYINEIQLADRDFRQAMSLDSNDPEINNNYGWYLCQIGREKEGLALFQRVIRNSLYETPDKAYANAGACYIKIGDLALAEGMLQHSLNLMPDNVQARQHMAAILYRRGELDAALQQLMEVVNKAEPGAEVLWLLVRIERKLGNRLAEARYSSQLRRKFPLSPEAQDLLKGHFE